MQERREETKWKVTVTEGLKTMTIAFDSKEAAETYIRDFTPSAVDKATLTLFAVRTVTVIDEILYKSQEIAPKPWTLEEIVDYALSTSEGSRYIHWPEAYDLLSDNDKEKAETLFHQNIDNCADCGHYQFSENMSEGPMTMESICDSCYDNQVTSLEEESND